MIITGLITILLGFFKVISLNLPDLNPTVVSTISTIVNEYVIPMFSMIKVWLPVDSLYFWASVTISLHISVIGFRLIARLIYLATGGLVKIHEI